MQWSLSLKNNSLWLLLLCWLILPVFLHNWSYSLHVLIMLAIYVLLTQSLNLVLGLAGQLQLGHAANFGIGAYIAGLLMVDGSFSFWATLPIAFIGAALVGTLIGLPSLRVGRRLPRHCDLGVWGDYAHLPDGLGFRSLGDPWGFQASRLRVSRVATYLPRFSFFIWRLLWQY